MDWQQLASLCIVMATAGLLVRRELRRRGSQVGGVAQCGCAGLPHDRPGWALVFRARKGKRPEIHVRMNP